jgi:hypothetical protein
VTFLTYAPRHEWVNQLINPLREDPQVSVTCAADMYAGGKLYFPFFCVGLQKSVLEKFNYLDEIFSPGSAEDIDFCVRAALKGYRHHPVPGGPVKLSSPKTFTGTFPIYHYAEGTFEHIEEYGNVTFKRNSLINLKRYNKDIKLHLTLEHDNSLPAHVRVGNSKYSEILLDWNRLDFEANTVSEIALIDSIERITTVDLSEYIKEWYRVLKPGGKLVL